MLKIWFPPSWSLSTAGSDRSVMSQAGRVSSSMEGVKPSTFWPVALRGIVCTTKACWSGIINTGSLQLLFVVGNIILSLFYEGGAIYFTVQREGQVHFFKWPAKMVNCP